MNGSDHVSKYHLVQLQQDFDLVSYTLSGIVDIVQNLQLIFLLCTVKVLQSRSPFI